MRDGFNIIIGAATAVTLAVGAYLVIAIPTRPPYQKRLTFFPSTNLLLLLCARMLAATKYTSNGFGPIGLACNVFTAIGVMVTVSCIARGVPPLKVLSQVGGLLSLDSSANSVYGELGHFAPQIRTLWWN